MQYYPASSTSARITMVCILALLGSFLLFSITSADIQNDNGMAEYEFGQRGGIPLPEKNLTPQEIAEAESVAAAEVGVNYVYPVPLYGQCWSPWRYYQLGWCSGVSICDAGCAMSCGAMLNAYYGANYNPGTLNDWLKANGGYYSGCNL